MQGNVQTMKVPNVQLYLRIFAYQHFFEHCSLHTKTFCDAYMVSVDNNLTTFNELVGLQVEALKQVANPSSNVMIKILQRSSAADQEYKEGQDISENTIVIMAENKFNRWNTPSKKQNKILALNARLFSLPNKTKKSELKKMAHNGSDLLFYSYYLFQ